jgi:hypothetical protein
LGDTKAIAAEQPMNTAREHGSRIGGWWRRLRTCDRIALAVFSLFGAYFLAANEIRTATDYGGTAAWDAPPTPYTKADAKARLWGATNATNLPTVAACARVRNEGPYLQEWLEFHLLAGIAHFYIFDDASTDNSREVLAPYVAKGIVRVWAVQEKCPKHRSSVCVDRSHDAEHGESGFRDECLRFNPDGAEWVAAIDVDEFLYPSAGTSLPLHLARNCDASLAYALVRWKVFGSGGYRRKPEGAAVDAYRARSVSDDTGCYPRLTCGDEYAPPACAKVVARARCVQKQGTHYVVSTSSECASIYSPEGSGRGLGKLAAPLPSAFARTQHMTCAAPLRLNHYAVRSREEYVAKFSRGRISSGARDTQKGIATRGPHGGYLRAVDDSDRDAFIDADVLPAGTRASKLTSTKDLMLAEFMRRDFSTVLDEGASQKYGLLLRLKLGAPSLTDHQTWACTPSTPDAASVEAARVWGHLAPSSRAKGLFLHIPKTAGTTLNSILREAAQREARTFCELSFRELDDRATRFGKARSCHLVSAETDVSALLQWPSRKTVAAFTFLRDPLLRAVSQVEHHRAAGGRILGGDARSALIRLVSPNLCPQLERDARCRFLRHPAKCLAGGWCGLFQNHQTQILAGALHVSEEARGAVRRSGENLLCAATKSLHALPVVGLTERLADSLCLVFDTLGYHQVFRDCCGHKTCSLLDRRETRHSGAARGNASYSSTYLSDDVLLAALYEGNRLDCALYEAASARLGADLAKLLPLSAPVAAASEHCRRGEKALARLWGY